MPETAIERLLAAHERRLGVLASGDPETPDDEDEKTPAERLLEESRRRVEAVESARRRLSERRAAGDEQWARIEASQPPPRHPLAERIGDPVEDVGRALVRGAQQTAGGLTSAAEWAARTVAEGGPGFVTRRMAEPVGEALGEQRELQKRYEVEPAEGVTGDFWADAEKNPVRALALYGAEQIPNLVLAMGGGVVGGVRGAVATAFPLEAGAAYDEAKESGATEEQARIAAGLTGIINMSLEASPVALALRRMGVGREAAKGLGRAILEQSLAEGSTETLQEYNNILAARLTYAADRGWSADELMADLKRSSAAGVVGAAIGGATAVAIGGAPPAETAQPAEPSSVEEATQETAEVAPPPEAAELVATEPEKYSDDPEVDAFLRTVLPLAEEEVEVVEGGEEAMQHADSAASPEAIARQAGGTSFYRIRPGGETIPLLGVDAVDASVPRGDIKVRLSPNGETVVEQGSANPRQVESMRLLQPEPRAEPAGAVTEPLNAPEASALPEQVKDFTAQSGFIGKRGGKTSPHAFEDPGTEAGFQRGLEGVPEPTIVERIKRGAVWIGRAMTSELHHVPGGARFAPFREWMRSLQPYESAVEGEVGRRLNNAFRPLTDTQSDLFLRTTLLNNLAVIAENNPEAALPFGFTPESLASEKGRIDAAVAADPYVQRSLEEVRKLWSDARNSNRQAAERLGIDASFLDRRGEDYLHHQVIQYALMERQDAARGELKPPRGRSFQRELKGSEKDINLDYGAAQGQVIAQLEIDAHTMNFLANLRDGSYNLYPELQEQAREMSRESGKRVDPLSLIPEGHQAWQMEPGNHFYMGASLSDRVAQRLIEEGPVEISTDDVSESMMVGGRRLTMVLPDEIVATLEERGQRVRDGFENKFFKLNRRVLTAWKRWVLLAPRRVFKYTTRNFLGDSQKVTMAAPAALKHLPSAIKDLAATHVTGADPSPRLRQWMFLGGWQSGLFQQEVSESHAERRRRMAEVTEVSQALSQVSDIKRLPGRYMRLVGKYVSLLEAANRYATFNHYLDQIEADPAGRPKNFAASKAEEIMALEDPAERAYWLSNQLIGAYDQVSEFGQFLRQHVAGFWSFQELNVRSHWGLIRNAVTAPDASLKTAAKMGVRGLATKAPFIAYRAAKLAGLMYAFESALFAINHGLFPDEERDLPEGVRKRPHIILGRASDGTVRYFDRLSVFAEAREWFGLDEFGFGINDYLNGRITGRQLLEDTASVPVNKIVNSISPTAGFGIKPGVELALEGTTFPEPRPIFDRTEYLAQMVGLEAELRALTSRPEVAGSYPRSWRGAFFYSAEPGASAYYDTLRAERRFLASIGEETRSVFDSARTRALRNYKRALRYEQPEVAAEYLAEYKMANGTAKGYLASLKRMHPLANVPKKYRQDFMDWMRPAEQEKLEAAIAYYEEVFGPETPGNEEALRFLEAP